LCRVSADLIGIQADEEQIGLGEVASQAQERLAGDGGDRVCAAVAEVQRGGMPDTVAVELCEAKSTMNMMNFRNDLPRVSLFPGQLAETAGAAW
jgi:hypothetical protein